MLNPSFVGNNCIEFNEILDSDNSVYLVIYGFFNNRLTYAVEFRILVIGIDKDIGINQICGQGSHRKAFPCRTPVFLYARDERQVFLEAGISSLPFAGACFSFSGIPQNLLSRQPSRQADYLKYLLSFSVFQLVPALFMSSMSQCLEREG